MLCVCGRFPLHMDSREQSSWVFRHTGPSPSIPECVEVVELKEGAVTFGRGAAADVYIDSLVLRNFISRRHAVVVGKKNEDGHLHFILYNHGLNGTYVNDIRVGEVHHLKEGDRVTFGHKNGYKVKVGETAQQPDSEFQFVLEQCQPAKHGLQPLQEHRQLVDTKAGKTCLSDSDETCSSAAGQNGQAAPADSTQQYSVSAKRKKGSDHQPSSCDDLSEFSSKAVSEMQTFLPVGDHGSEAKAISFTGKGSPKVNEVIAAKENKSADAKARKQAFNERTNPGRRYSDDGIPCSFWNTSKLDSPRLLSVSDDTRHPSKKSKLSSSSSSPKYSAPKSSKLPKGSEKTCSPHLDISVYFSVHKDKSSPPKEKKRSGRSSVKNHKHKSALPMLDDSAERSRLPRHRSSRNASLSPKPQHVSKLPNGKVVKRNSCSTGSLCSEKDSESSGSSDRSRSPREGSHSSSIYDEPPVLTPEYVKTPSLEIGSPSPTILSDRENFDEVDDIDRDSMFCSVPHSPGDSFFDLNPGPQGLSISTEHHRDVFSHYNDREVSSTESHLDSRSAHGHRGRSRDGTLSAVRQNNRHCEKEKRHASEKKHEKDPKQQSNTGSKTITRHVEPDSTTSVSSASSNSDKVVCHADSDNRWKSQRTSRKEQPSRQRTNEKECSESSQAFRSGRDSDRFRTITGISLQKSCKPQMKDKTERSPLPPKTMDRNVFEHFSSDDVLSSDNHLKRKRHSSEDLDIFADDSSEIPHEAAKFHSSQVEKENGLTPDKDTSARHSGQDLSSKEKQHTDRPMLRDVRISIQRMNHHDKVPTTPSKSNTAEPEKKCSENSMKTAKHGNGDGNKQQSNMATKSKLDGKESQECKDSTDMSLFGMEMERLGMMRLKERKRSPREKSSKVEKPSPSNKNTRELSRQPEILAGNATVQDTKSSSKERRSQRIVKFRSQSPDAYWSESEESKPKPVRKIATRRPRQSRANKDEKTPHKDQNVPRASRPTRRRKIKKKEEEEDEDDEEEGEEDESLEEGVTWYEEDTCASAHCHRPSDRRVQWVCCDDCDSWYHTVCVGIFLEDLKEDEDYHCGCV